MLVTNSIETAAVPPERVPSEFSSFLGKCPSNDSRGCGGHGNLTLQPKLASPQWWTEARPSARLRRLASNECGAVRTKTSHSPLYVKGLLFNEVTWPASSTIWRCSLETGYEKAGRMRTRHQLHFGAVPFDYTESTMNNPHFISILTLQARSNIIIIIIYVIIQTPRAKASQNTTKTPHVSLSWISLHLFVSTKKKHWLSLLDCKLCGN